MGRGLEEGLPVIYFYHPDNPLSQTDVRLLREFRDWEQSTKYLLFRRTEDYRRCPTNEVFDQIRDYTGGDTYQQLADGRRALFERLVAG